MKMAKASEIDLQSALALTTILENLERGDMPDSGNESSECDEHFDIEDGEKCKKALRSILGAIEHASLFRVTFGMAVVCDPRNKVLDPGSDILELHPEHLANSLNASRYTAAREAILNRSKGQVWAALEAHEGEGGDVTQFDQDLDGAIAAQQQKEVGGAACAD